MLAACLFAILFACHFHSAVLSAPTGLSWEHHELRIANGALRKGHIAGATTCAPLCWKEHIQALNLDIFNVLTTCFNLNVTEIWNWQPEFNSVVQQPVEVRNGYAYRNRWTDFSLGDSMYNFQAWRTRWMWNLDLTEIVYSQIYQSDATKAEYTATFDTLATTSRIYRIYNETAIEVVETRLEQIIPFEGSASVSSTTEISHYPRLSCQPLDARHEPR